MLSSFSSENPELCALKNCTSASTFDKAKSLRFELLFGFYQNKVSRRYSDESIVNAFDYIFLPSTLFGFSCESMGQDFKKFHYAFVLRSCAPGESGGIISGISPGAKILVKTLTSAASLKLKTILKKLKQNKINLSSIPVSYYLQLNRLLDTKSNTDFFVGELIENFKEA
jgi:hypothetical protein